MKICVQCWCICLQGNPYAWCATAVDANGVMLPQRTGVCDDERNVAYDGPGKLEHNKTLVT